MSGQYPRITTGLGKLTPELWDRLMDALRFVETDGYKLAQKKPETRYPISVGSPVVLLSITNAIESVNPFQWTYGWSEFVLDGGQFVAKEEGRTDLVEGYGRAINPEERLNVQSGIVGYGIQSITELATATPQPIPSASIVPAVLVRDVTDEVLRPVMMPATNALVISCGEP